MSLLDKSWLAKLTTFNKIIVGFSGGLDSSALLHALSSYPELHSKLLAIHVNHSISTNANSWQVHCQQFCDDLNVELQVFKISIKSKASLEEQARDARYKIFQQAIGANDCLVLGHHQNDQAETVLFNLIRGAGVNGLTGIPSTRNFSSGILLRPLLDFKRSTLLNYALANNLVWIEDESNTDVDLARNYLRHEVLPLILAKWPHALENFTACAKNLKDASSNLADLAIIDSPSLSQESLELNLKNLQGLANERIINVLRCWFSKNQILSPSRAMYLRIINEVIGAKSDKIPKLCFGGIILRRYQNRLYIDSTESINHKAQHWKNFPDPLYLEDGRVIYAQLDNEGIAIEDFNNIWVKFRQGGESIKYNGQTKKLKKLLQELGVLPWRRNGLPLLYVDNHLQAVIGLLNADDYQPKDMATKYKISMGD